MKTVNVTVVYEKRFDWLGRLVSFFDRGGVFNHCHVVVQDGLQTAAYTMTARGLRLVEDYEVYMSKSKTVGYTLLHCRGTTPYIVLDWMTDYKISLMDCLRYISGLPVRRPLCTVVYSELLPYSKVDYTIGTGIEEQLRRTIPHE